MKCEICEKEIKYKNELYAGPWNPTKSFYIGALSEEDIKTFHRSCWKTISVVQKMHDKKILPIMGVW